MFSLQNPEYFMEEEIIRHEEARRSPLEER